MGTVTIWVQPLFEFTIAKNLERLVSSKLLSHELCSAMFNVVNITFYPNLAYKWRQYELYWNVYWSFFFTKYITFIILSSTMFLFWTLWNNWVNTYIYLLTLHYVSLAKKSPNFPDSSKCLILQLHTLRYYKIQPINSILIDINPNRYLSLATNVYLSY